MTMATWLVPPSDLTTEQIRAIELPTDEHKVVMGGPGSGKTIVLLYRAQHLARAGNVPAERFHVFVFTNVLSTYIRSAMELLDIPEPCVSTFDDWCRQYYETHISRRIPWDKVAKHPDFPAIREGVLNHCGKSGRANHLFDFVLVDEGQDLDRKCFELLTRIAAHVTVCMDHNQQIYDGGSDEGEILGALGLKRRQVAFLETFRCCPYITQMASLFIPDERQRAAYLQQTKTAQTDIETPLLYRMAGFDDEKQMLIEMVRLRVQKGDRVAALLPLKRQVFGFAKGMREAGLDVETQDDLDFGSDTPKVITYHSAKGLTFDAVLLPRLTASSFSVFSPKRIERLLFVALTRATRWVYLSTDGRLPLLQRLEPLVKDGRLTVRTAAGPSTQQRVSKRDDTGDLLDAL